MIKDLFKKIIPPTGQDKPAAGTEGVAGPMDDKARNQLIARLLAEKRTLSEIQKILEKDHQLRLTYMELRLIASELKVDWKKVEGDKKPAAAAPAAGLKLLGDEPGPGGARTEIAISKLVRPGAIFSGSVKFKSGASGEWAVDQMGRLGLTPSPGSARPTEDDIQDFQVELQRKLQGQA